MKILQQITIKLKVHHIQQYINIIIPSDTNINNYGISLNRIFGDAICETSISGSEKTSWHLSKSHFANSSNPFFTRGGGYNISYAGLFYFNIDNGGDYANIGGSRVVCIVK